MRAGREIEPRRHRRDAACRQAPEQCHALLERLLEGDLPRIACSVTAFTWSETPGKLRQLVDAFLPDDRRVHIGQQQPLATTGGRDERDIDRSRRQCPLSSSSRVARRLMIEGELAGFRLGQPDRLSQAAVAEDGERPFVQGA